jgi:hypothetical protein
MAIRPLRTRTTKDDIKNYKEAMSKASKLTKPANKYFKLTRYITITIGSSLICYLITKQFFNWLTKNSSVDE